MMSCYDHCYDEMLRDQEGDVRTVGGEEHEDELTVPRRKHEPHIYARIEIVVTF